MPSKSANPNQAIFDATVRHRIALERYSTDASKQTLGYLEDLKTDLSLRMATATPGRRVQLQRLLEDAQELHGATYQKITKSLSLQFKTVASKEAEWQGLKARAAGIEGTFTRITTDAAYAAAMQRPMDGALLKDWMNDLGPKARGRLERQLRISWTEGENLSSALTRANSAVDLNGRAAKALIRTSNAHISASVQQASFEANADLIAEVEWRSVLDGRTTPLCQSRDGERYPVDSGPRPPAHISCRSIVVEILKDFPPPQRETYSEWINRQKADVQDEILGPSRGRLLRQGAYNVKGFVDERGKALTLADLGDPGDVAKKSPAEKIKIGSALTAASKGANGKHMTQMIAEYNGDIAQAAVIDGYFASAFNIFGPVKVKQLKAAWANAKIANPPAAAFAPFDAKQLGLPAIPTGTVASATKAANAKKVVAFFDTKIKHDQWAKLGKDAAIEAADHIAALAKSGAFGKVKATELGVMANKLKAKAAVGHTPSVSFGSNKLAAAANAPYKSPSPKPIQSAGMHQRDKEIDALLATPDLPKELKNIPRDRYVQLWNMYGGSTARGNASEITVFEEGLIRAYTGSAYSAVNRELRGGKPDPVHKLYAAIVNNALRRLDSPEPPKELYRGVGTAKMERWEQALRSFDPDTEVFLRANGVNSFSSKKTVATGFGARGGRINGRNVKGFMWIVKKPTKTETKEVKKLSQIQREDEWIYKHGSMFKVMKVEIPEKGPFSGFAVVTLREAKRVPKTAVIEAAKIAGRATPKTTASGLVKTTRTPRGELRTARQDAVDDMLQKQVATGFEHATVLGSGGRTLWSGTSGARGSVRIRGIDKAARGERVEIHHTHPADQSLSLEDLLLTNRNGRENVWVYAHSAAGGRFKARALRDLEGIADRVDMSGPIAQQGVFRRAPDISADDNQNLSWHIVMLALKRSGRIEYSAALSAKQSALVGGIGRQGMDEIVSDVVRFIGDD